MWRKHTLLALVAGIIALGVSPLSASGSADFDENYAVDFNDLSLWTGYWLYDYNDNRQCESWDLAENGIIDLNDLVVIANYWITDYDFEDFSDFGQFWRRTVDYRFLDTRFDLVETGLVDFGDFSAFAGEWMTTTNPCNDINVSGPWMYRSFTGIGGCNATGCLIYGDDYSDYIYDNCGNYLYMV